jgi:hypothetical protein
MSYWNRVASTSSTATGASRSGHRLEQAIIAGETSGPDARHPACHRARYACSRPRRWSALAVTSINNRTVIEIVASDRPGLLEPDRPGTAQPRGRHPGRQDTHGRRTGRGRVSMSPTRDGRPLTEVACEADLKRPGSAPSTTAAEDIRSLTSLHMQQQPESHREHRHNQHIIDKAFDRTRLARSVRTRQPSCAPRYRPPSTCSIAGTHASPRKSMPQGMDRQPVAEESRAAALRHRTQPAHRSRLHRLL